MTRPPRALMPDYLRLFALFGIVIVNVQYIAFSVLHNLTDPIAVTTSDAVTLWLVNGLALLKTYGLFSFMFGVGLAFMMRSAQRRGLRFGKMYRNRMIGLLIFGLAHGCLFFPGDILVIYAIMGSILYRLRDWEADRLVRLGAGLLIAQVALGTPLLLMPSDYPPAFLTLEDRVLSGDSFRDAAQFRTVGFVFTLPVALIAQGLSALGWFCLGLAAVKSGMIDNQGHPLWHRARRWCLLPGVGLSLLGAAMWQWGATVPGAALVVVAAPVTTLGYLGLIAALAQAPGPMMHRVLAAGGSSLSIYLGQSIILSTVFAGYGLDLWEEVSRATAVAMAIGVTGVLIGLLTLWRAWFSQGPFELVLRRITYTGVRPSSGPGSHA